MREKLRFEVTFPNNLGVGPVFDRNAATGDSEFSRIISGNNGKAYGQVIITGVNLVFKNKIGFHTDLSFSGTGFKREFMLNELHKAYPQNYYYHNGKSFAGPTSIGPYRYLNIKPGISYSFHVGDSMRITPFINYVFSRPNFSTIQLESKLTGSNYFSYHTITPEHLKSFGYEVGVQLGRSGTDVYPGEKKGGGARLYFVFGQNFTRGEWHFYEKSFFPTPAEHFSMESFTKRTTYAMVGCRIYFTWVSWMK